MISGVGLFWTLRTKTWPGRYLEGQPCYTLHRGPSRLRPALGPAEPRTLWWALQGLWPFVSPQQTTDARSVKEALNGSLVRNLPSQGSLMVRNEGPNPDCVAHQLCDVGRPASLASQSLGFLICKMGMGMKRVVMGKYNEK